MPPVVTIPALLLKACTLICGVTRHIAEFAEACGFIRGPPTHWLREATFEGACGRSDLVDLLGIAVAGLASLMTIVLLLEHSYELVGTYGCAGIFRGKGLTAYVSVSEVVPRRRERLAY